jgi:hypothetical protein
MGRLRVSHRIARLGLAVLISVVAPGIAASAAAAAGVTVEVLPSALTPKAGGQRSITLIARNDGPVATHITVSVVRGTTNSEYALTEKPDESPPWRLGRLAKGEERSWNVQVVTPARFLAGTDHFVVRYVVAGKTKIVSAPFEVQSVAQTKLEDLVFVDAKTALDSLDEKQNGYVYLLVTNKSAVDITVADVRGEGPDFIDFTPPGPTTIGPRQTRSLAVQVSPRDRVRPGKYLMVFHVPITWSEDAGPQNAEVTLTYPTNVAVYGESAILKAVDAPLLLFLPGILIAAAFALVGRTIPGQDDSGDTVKSGVTAVVIGLSISLLLAYIIPRVGGPDYVAGYYNYNDIVWLWFVSLAIGVVLGLLWFRFFAEYEVKIVRRAP